MKPTNVTVKILRQIRDSVEKTNARLDETSNVMQQKFDLLTDRVVEGEIRKATAITALAGTLDAVKNLLVDRLDLRDRVERCERDIVVLKVRAGIE